MDVAAIIAIIGGIAFIVGLFGGGLEAKEIKIPKIAGWLRAISMLVGIGFIGIAIWLSYSDRALPTSPPALVAAVTDTPTAIPAPPVESPTLTRLPPTPTPTTKPVVSMTYDEDFADARFDGKWNTELWSLREGEEGSAGTVEQRDGALMVNLAAGLFNSFTGLTTENHSHWTLNDLGFIEADLMLSDNLDGQFGDATFVLISDETNWSVSCMIAMCQEEPDCTAKQPWMVCYSPDQYAPDGVTVEFNSWHTSRLEVNPETASFDFYFDGYYFDTFTPPNAETLKDDSFYVVVGVYVKDKSSITGYIDNVRIGQK